MSDQTFPVLSLKRTDLDTVGYNGALVDDDQMAELAEKIGDSLTEQLFWVSLKTLAEDMDLPKKQETERWLVLPVDSTGMDDRQSNLFLLRLDPQTIFTFHQILLEIRRANFGALAPSKLTYSFQSESVWALSDSDYVSELLDDKSPVIVQNKPSSLTNEILGNTELVVMPSDSSKLFQYEFQIMPVTFFGEQTDLHYTHPFNLLDLEQEPILFFDPHAPFTLDDLTAQEKEKLVQILNEHDPRYWDDEWYEVSERFSVNLWDENLTEGSMLFHASLHTQELRGEEYAETDNYIEIPWHELRTAK